jgi:hypothetical protein
MADYDPMLSARALLQPARGGGIAMSNAPQLSQGVTGREPELSGARKNLPSIWPIIEKMSREEFSQWLLDTHVEGLLSTQGVITRLYNHAAGYADQREE